MKKVLKGYFVLALMVCVGMCLPKLGWGADTKIGYFDIQTVIDQSKAGKQAKEEFKKQQEKMKTDVDQKAKDFKSLKDEFDKKSSVLDDKAKDKKTRELLEKRQEAEKVYMDSSNKLGQLSNQLSAPIIDKVLSIVRRIGKDDKYDYIFEVQKGGIVWASEKGDLTKKVLDELDKTMPVLPAPAPAAAPSKP